MKQKFLDLEQQRTNQIFELENLPIINATPEEMYRIAEVNPNLFGVKYTRWGCNFKCIKCNVPNMTLIFEEGKEKKCTGCGKLFTVKINVTKDNTCFDLLKELRKEKGE